MKCPGCKGKMKKGKTNFPVELSGGLLYIKSVPSDVCPQCGEVYFSDKIAESLEKIGGCVRDVIE